MADDPALQRSITTSKRNTAYISNFRSSLTALVILHHAATTYGGEGSSAYQPYPAGSSSALIGFNAINQSHFMGAFMYLAGHFSKKALARKSKSQFVKDRLYRLAFPSVAYTVLGAPACVVIHRIWNGERVDLAFLLDYWRDLRSLRGSIWFTGTLFCFDMAFVGWTKVQEILNVFPPPKHDHAPTKNVSITEQHSVGGTRLFASLALCSASDFMLRTISPCGQASNPLRLQPAYVSQYIASYVFGACVDNIQDAVPSDPASVWALRAASGLTSYFMFNRLFSGSAHSFERMKGGWSGMAATYAIWNNVFGYMLGSRLLQIFASYSTESWGWINDAAFPAFLLHMPILTAVGVSTDRWRAGPLVKTAVVGSVTVVLSWAAGYTVNVGWSWIAAHATNDKKKID